MTHRRRRRRKPDSRAGTTVPTTTRLKQTRCRLDRPDHRAAVRSRGDLPVFTHPGRPPDVAARPRLRWERAVVPCPTGGTGHGWRPPQAVEGARTDPGKLGPPVPP